MAKQDVTVELFYSGVWNDHTVDTLVRDQITVTYGRENESGQPAPATAKLTFLTWRFNPRNPTSDLHGLIGRNTPLRITVGASQRFQGEVASWTPRQSLGGEIVPPDRWVEVVAAGITRRLDQGADPLRDAVHRFVQRNRDQCIGYWPLSDPRGAARAASGIDGSAMRPVAGLFDRPQFGSGAPAPWLPPSIETSGTVGRLRASGLDGATTGGWVVDLMYRVPEPSTWGEDWPQQVDVLVRDAGAGQGDDVAWRVTLRPADEALDLGVSEHVVRLLIVVTGSPPVAAEVPFPDVLTDGQPHHLRVRAFEQAGNAAALFLDVDGVNVAFVQNSDIGTAAIQPPTEVSLEWTTLLNAGGEIIARVPVTLTQVAMWKETVPGLPDSVDAYFGHSGETSGSRMNRLTNEEDNVPLVFINVGPSETQPAGPQYPDALLALLREAADLDRGILLDDRLRVGLTYRPVRELYNHDPDLVLDYSAGQVAPPLDPTLDDQRTRNDITVQRRDGDSVQVTLDVGAMSTQPPPDGVGRVQESSTINAMSDGLLGDQAGWRLHLGTADEIRFPRVTVDLDANPELAGLASNLRPGDRIAVTSLPSELSPDALSLLVQGYTETIGSHRRKITFNCTPENPYHIAQIEHAVYATLGSDSATVDEVGGLDETETSIFVDAGAGPDWIHEGIDYDIVIGGERMTVTDVGAPTGTFPNRLFNLTVTRSVNGVVKSHPDGAPVAMFDPAYIGL